MAANLHMEYYNFCWRSGKLRVTLAWAGAAVRSFWTFDDLMSGQARLSSSDEALAVQSLNVAHGFAYRPGLGRVCGGRWRRSWIRSSKRLHPVLLGCGRNNGGPSQAVAESSACLVHRGTGITNYRNSHVARLCFARERIEPFQAVSLAGFSRGSRSNPTRGALQPGWQRGSLTSRSVSRQTRIKSNQLRPCRQVDDHLSKIRNLEIRSPLQ